VFFFLFLKLRRGLHTRQATAVDRNMSTGSWSDDCTVVTVSVLRCLKTAGQSNLALYKYNFFFGGGGGVLSGLPNLTRVSDSSSLIARSQEDRDTKYGYHSGQH
jgi:hypothetical protein